MTSYRRDPFRGFDGIAKKMYSIMDEIDKGVSIEYGKFSPRIDISEDEQGIYLHAEIPGVKKEDLNVSLNEENVLVLKGEKKSEKSDESEENGRTLIRMERSFGSFSRSFMLPDNVITDSIKAKFSDGILDIRFDKKEPELPVNKEIVIE